MLRFYPYRVIAKFLKEGEAYIPAYPAIPVPVVLRRCYAACTQVFAEGLLKVGLVSIIEVVRWATSNSNEFM